MYGNINGTTYEEVHKNVNDSTIKKVDDEWYKINIDDKGYSNYVVDAIYCNDRSVYSGTGIGTSTTYYVSYIIKKILHLCVIRKMINLLYLMI